MFCLLIPLVVAIYASQAGQYFIHDSVASVKENSAIQIDGTQLDAWRAAALSTDTGPLGRPISMLSFAANHVFAEGTSGQQIRITNALLHVLCGVFLWLFLRCVMAESPLLRWDRQRANRVACLAAALWLLHPLHVSTVFYTVQRMTQLATLFSFVGLWCVFSIRCKWLYCAPKPADYSRAAFWLAVFTGLGAFSKESGLLLPLLAAATELCLFRFRVAGGRSATLRLVALSLLAAPVVLVLCAVALEPIWLQRAYIGRDFELGERIFTQVRILWHYVGWILLPDITGMAFHHDDIALSRGLLNPFSTLLALVAWCAVFWLTWLWRNRWPMLGFALLWYLYGHSMESSIWPLEMVYEHRNYLPAAGPLLLVASLLFLPGPAWQGYARFATVLLIVMLGYSLILRSIAWSDEKSLAEHNYRHHPTSIKTTVQLASVYLTAWRESGDAQLAQQFAQSARELLTRALELDENYVPALVMLILIDSNSSDTGMVPQWYARLDSALARPAMHHSDVKFITLQNECVLQKTCLAPAWGQEEFLRSLLVRHPSKSHLRYELALYCFRIGDQDCARAEAETLIEKQPRFFPALELIYATYQKEGKLGQSRETVRRLLLADKDRRLPGRLLRQTASQQ